MKKLLTFLTLLTLFFGVGWAAEGIIWFGNQGTKINSASVHGTDDKNNTWYITTEGTSSFTQSSAYSQVGSSKYPATSITFTTTLPSSVNITSMEAKFGGFSGTTGTVNLKVGDTSIGTGNLNGTNDVTISSNSTATGNTLTVTVTDIDKGVKCYYISYTYSNGGTTVETVATPTFSPAQGTYYEAQNVTISCATDGATIHYTTDGSDPDENSPEYNNSPISVSETTTIKAIAVKDGMNNSAVATATYTITAPLTSLAAVNGLANDEVFTYGAQTVVLGKSGKNMYIVMPDNTAGTLVYDASNSWSDDYTFGKVINSGWGGTKTTYSTKPEVNNPTNFSLSSTTAEVTPIEITSSNLTLENFGRYAVLKGVTVTSGGAINGITTYDQFGVNFNSSAGSYDVYGVIGWHNSAGQFMPLEYVPASAPAYYLAGSFNNWGQNDDYIFTESNGTYTLNGVDLPDNAEFQIIKVVNNSASWYGGATNDDVYGIHGGWHENITLTQGAKNFKIEAGAITNFSFTVDANGNPSVLNVNRDAQLFLKGDMTAVNNSWQREAMTLGANGWTINKDIAATNQFGFVNEWGAWYGGNGYWIYQANDMGNALSLNSNGNFYMVDAGNYNLTVNTALTTLTVTSTAGDTYTLVTNASELNENDSYIIVSKDYESAMGEQGTNNRRGAEVTINGNNAIASNDVEVFSLEGNATDGWYFKATKINTGYLYAASNSSNHLKTEAEPDANGNALASISINASSGVASVVFQGANSHNVMQYNSGSDLFACYSEASQKAVYLYKKGASNTSAAPVITPASGNIVGFSQEVTMTQSNGGNIYYTYTTDGTEPADPTTESEQYNSQNKFWAEVDNLGQEVWIKAVAKEGNKDLSSVVSVKYRFIAPKNPVFDPKAGTFSTPQSVSITTATEGAKVYYTTNANLSAAEIATQGTEFTEPIIVTETTTLYAVSVYYDAHTERNAVSSNKVTAKYTIVGEDDVVPVYSIAEFNALETGLKARFMNPVTVLYDYSQRSYSSQLGVTTYQEYIWVKDETGFTQIYLRPSLNSNNTTSVQTAFYENGDVIPEGFIVDKQYYETGQYVQAYSERAGDDPTQPGNNVTAGFMDTDQKALADPEPMTAKQLSELTTSDDNIATYNNRYISISKVKITNNTVNTNKQFKIAGENTSISNVVGYNKYSDQTSYQKNGSTAVVSVPDVSNTYYDVIAILQVWQNGWEIMPISFTPWSPDQVTLRELCDKGDVNNTYTISNPLQVVYVDTDEKSVWVKDDNGQSILKTVPEDPNSENFAIDYADNTRSEQANYDQSNWCQLVFASADDIPSSFASNPIINGGIITGKFTNKMNPTLEITNLGEDPIMTASSNYDPNYYVAANFSGPQLGYFFMNPKPQEYAHIVWAIYDETNNAMIMTSNPKQNPNGFVGSFKVDMSMNIKPNLELVDGTQTGKGYEHFKAIVRLASTSNAPMLKDRMPANTEYVVFPLDITQDVPTGITDVNGKAVKSVKYVNVAGMVSDKPFSGVNIVVTEYTDGSRSTSKMLKR